MKNGFTLIELLAVIVILAIISLIAVPIVLNIIEDAKRSSLLRSAEFYLDAVEYAIANAIMYHGGITDETYLITSDGNICIDKLDDNKCPSDKILKVEVNGQKPNNGYIEIKNGQISLFAMSLSEKTITKNEKGELEVYDAPIPKSFSEDSWDVIAANVRAGNLSRYKVNDTKEIEITGYGKKIVRIANTSTPDECKKDGFSQTACGFVVEFQDIITYYSANPYYDNYGGWKDSDVNKFLNGTIINKFPKDLKENIIETYVVSNNGYYNSTLLNSTEKLYLLSTKEVYGTNGSFSDPSHSKTRQLDYYEIYNSYSNKIKSYNGYSEYWWLRSAYTDGTDAFYRVDSAGHYWGTYAISYYGVAPAFRIG